MHAVINKVLMYYVLCTDVYKYIENGKKREFTLSFHLHPPETVEVLGSALYPSHSHKAIACM